MEFTVLPEENTGDAELIQGAQFLLDAAENLTGAKEIKKF